MNTKPTVVKNDTAGGLIITPSSNNPEYGSIRVEQLAPEFNGRFLNIRKRVAFINGTIADLTAMNFTEGQKLPGKIVVKESLVPLKADDPEYGIKLSGKDGIPCTIEDQPIYRTTFYTEDPKDYDVLIQHDNSDEIKRARLLQQERALIGEPNFS